MEFLWNLPYANNQFVSVRKTKKFFVSFYSEICQHKNGVIRSYIRIRQNLGVDHNVIKICCRSGMYYDGMSD